MTRVPSLLLFCLLPAAPAAAPSGHSSGSTDAFRRGRMLPPPAETARRLEHLRDEDRVEPGGLRLRTAFYATGEMP